MILHYNENNEYNYIFKAIQGILIGFIALVLIIAINLWAYKDKAVAAQDVSRPSSSGYIHQDGMKTLDDAGNEVWLRGISTHGLTYAPEFVNEKLFSQLSNDWSVNLIRLAMYSEEYCFKNKKKSLKLLHNGIEYAIKNDMYVIVDWHILRDSNPNKNLEQALDFFANISSEYSNCPNIIYEICNEPNGETTWADIVDYANKVIPVIRNNSPKSMILVGTPDNCRDLNVAVENPIMNFNNLMYVFHFYAASHKDEMRNTLNQALANKLPVFISEFGISEETGDGLTSYEEAAKWMDIVNEHKLNYAMWSFSNINETSAIFKNYANFPQSIDEENLSSSGYWIKSILQNKDPHSLVNPGQNTLEYLYSLKTKAYTVWWFYAISAALITFIILMFLILRGKRDNKKSGTYYDVVKKKVSVTKFKKQYNFNTKNIEQIGKLLVVLCIFFFVVYLHWRIICSMPLRYGWVAVLFNLLLLFVEIIGFWESVSMCINLLKSYRNNLPVIAADEYPDVDVFIATYNEPKDLLIKTINGCVNMKYPNKEKVHIYLCDDTRRKEIKQLAKDMNVNYLDRESNEGAKAGNLNNALTKTNSPYVVTFDADMIPKSDFLLKTIPYFVDSEKLNKDCPDSDKIELGFIQTPQSFYQPDIFQHNFYLEKKLNNEQDFFYRIIECAKTSTNCVVYGGSNTVLSRKALESIGGFYTKSVTEDFATGMLIQAAGFVSLGLPEPLAYGQTPNTFEDHKKQRIRWARGVISTRKNLKKDVNKKFTYFQKLNYWCCSSYWYFPLKNLVYFLLPMLYSVFGLIVVQCSIFDLLLFWIPQIFLQILSLKVISKNKYSFTINTIGEVALTPFLVIPVLKELFGFQMQKFQVTDKSGKSKQEKKSYLWAIPFIVFIIFSIYCIWDSVSVFMLYGYAALIVLIFWLLLNAFYVIAAMTLISCKRKTTDSTVVHDKVSGSINLDNNIILDAVYDEFQDKKVFAKLDDVSNIKIDQNAVLNIPNKDKNIKINCQVGKIGDSGRLCFKIKDELISTSDYLQFLYDRTPSLPNSIRYINSVYLVIHSIASRFGNKKK